MLCQSLLFAAVLICIPACRVFWSGSLTATKRSMQCTNLNVRHRHRKKHNNSLHRATILSTETVHIGRSKLDQHDVPFPSTHTCDVPFPSTLCNNRGLNIRCGGQQMEQSLRPRRRGGEGRDGERANKYKLLLDVSTTTLRLPRVKEGQRDRDLTAGTVALRCSLL